MAMPVPTQYVLYTNDGMEVSYLDGSRLIVSPCGSSFQYHKAPSEVHPLFRNYRAENRSQFATQDVRPWLIDGLDFRNRFAERPFLCKDLLDPKHVIKLHADIQEIAWPKNVNSEVLQTLKDGSTRLVSEDEFAVITLGANRQHATVEYLAKVSQKVSRRSLETPLRRNADNGLSKCDRDRRSLDSAVNKATNDDQDNCRWCYVWTVQYYSIHCCPDSWRTPLDLIMKYLEEADANLGTNNAASTENNGDSTVKPQGGASDLCETSRETSNEDCCPSQRNISLKKLLKKDFSGCLFTSVPKTLPLNCFAQHLHRWENNMLPSNSNGTAEAAYMQGRVKVICVQGVIYRLIWTGARGIEIYPGDGSVIVSTSSSGKFFNHYIPKDGKIVERMYLSESLPPTSPSHPYSVNKLVTRALRFLQLALAENLQLINYDEKICWKQQEKQFLLSPNQIPSTKLLEENVVGGVGKFSAYSNGQIHIKFLDRTILDMTFDYSCGNVGAESIHSRLLALRKTLNIRDGMCRLLLPSGHYQYVSIDDPGNYEKYVNAALAWRNWVTTEPDERQKEIDDQQGNTRRIYQELKKIQCFNFLLENSLLAKFSPLVAASQSKGGQLENEAEFLMRSTTPTGVDDLCAKLKSASLEQNDNAIDQDMIKQILQRTSAAVEDIGTFLKSNGELKPMKD